MFYYRIQSFLNSFGQPDWKGMPISKNIPGSQIYFGNEVIFANSEMVQKEGVLFLSEAEYLSLRESWLDAMVAEKQTIEQRIAALENSYAELQQKVK
jgi:hypothetical protein